MLNTLHFSNIEIKNNLTELGFLEYLQKEFDNLKIVFTDNQLPDIQGTQVIQTFK